MNATQIFEQHGMEFHDEEHAMAELAELEPDELWTLTEQFTGDEAIGVSGDEETQSNTLRFALVKAFANDADRITQDDIDLAQETALSLINDIEDETGDDQSVEDTSASTEESSVVADSGEESAPVEATRTRKRTSTSRELIKTLVTASPDTPRNEILEEAFKQGADVAEATAVMYFYDVRKELGIDPNGKRGRKPTNTQAKVKALVLENYDNERADLINLIVEQLGYKENTATVYYHNALKALKEEGSVE